eukprot:3637731-Rhodomonas_salina.1
MASKCLVSIPSLSRFSWKVSVGMDPRYPTGKQSCRGRWVDGHSVWLPAAVGRVDAEVGTVHRGFRGDVVGGAFGDVLGQVAPDE